MKDFYVKLAEILEVQEVIRGDRLDDFDEWDSLGVLSIMTMIDESYGILISNNEIRNLITVGDLEDLLVDKLK